MELEYQLEEGEAQSKPKLINKTTKLGKKTVLNQNNIILEQNNIKNDSNDNEEMIIIRNDDTYLNQKENSSTFLIKTILKAYYLSIWKRQVKAMKYYTRGYNQQRTNFKKLISQISLAIKHHKFDYFNEIVENMNNMPMPKNVIHDSNFGTLRIVDKKRLTDKNRLWEQNNYENKNIGLKLNLIE